MSYDPSTTDMSVFRKWQVLAASDFLKLFLTVLFILPVILYVNF